MPASGPLTTPRLFITGQGVQVVILWPLPQCRIPPWKVIVIGIKFHDFGGCIWLYLQLCLCNLTAAVLELVVGSIIRIRGGRPEQVARTFERKVKFNTCQFNLTPVGKLASNSILDRPIPHHALVPLIYRGAFRIQTYLRVMESELRSNQLLNLANDVSSLGNHLISNNIGDSCY